MGRVLKNNRANSQRASTVNGVDLGFTDCSRLKKDRANG
jgi:hypothetical protein